MSASGCQEFSSFGVSLRTLFKKSEGRERGVVAEKIAEVK